MKTCKDCKNISKCEYVWPSKPCEKWEPDRFWNINRCEGYQKNEYDDEPCEQCKKCKYCISKESET